MRSERELSIGVVDPGDKKTHKRTKKRITRADRRRATWTRDPALDSIKRLLSDGVHLDERCDKIVGGIVERGSLDETQLLCFAATSQHTLEVHGDSVDLATWLGDLKPKDLVPKVVDDAAGLGGERDRITSAFAENPRAHDDHSGQAAREFLLDPCINDITKRDVQDDVFALDGDLSCA